MNKFLFLMLIMPSFIFGQVLIENFEDERHLNYVEKSGEFISDNPNEAPALMGGMYWGTANPDMTGINQSPRCGSYMRNAVESFDYFVTIPAGGFTNLNDFTDGSNFFTLDVWTPEENTTFLLSFENREIALVDPDSLDGVHSRFTATSSVANAWHTVVFDFLDFPDLNISEDDIDQMVVLVNNDMEGNDVTIYFDNLYGPDFGCMDVDETEVIENFECHRELEYSFTHGGIDFVTNPQQSGSNTSEKCGFYESYGAGDENGNVINIFTFDPPLNFGDYNSISMNVKSTFMKNVQLTLQDGNNSYTAEVETSGNDTWSELVFDYSDVSASEFTQAILIFAPGELEAGYTFYYDDIALTQTTSVEENINTDNITIVDNFIYFSEMTASKHIKVYDLSGRLILDEVCQNNSFELMPKGLLLVSISDNNGLNTTIKHLNK